MEDFFGDCIRLSVAESSTTLEGDVPPPSQLGALGDKNEPIIHHQRDDLGRWMPSRVEGVGRLQICVEVCREAYKSGYKPAPRSSRQAVTTPLADTGAQMCVAVMSLASRMGLTTKDLLQTKLNISVADNGGLSVVGAAFVVITGQGGVQSGQTLYFAEGVQDFFLSKEVCHDLGLIDSELPRVGSHDSR